MTGLLLKDLLNLKKQGKMFAIIILFYLILSMMSDNNSFFQAFIIMLFSMLPITALTYDERVNWDKYALTMPISRKDLVIGKYLLGLVTSLMGVLLCFVFQIFHAKFDFTAITIESLFVLLIYFSLGLFFVAVNMPLMFKFGTEKGRIVFLGFAVVIMLVPMMLQDIGSHLSDYAYLFNYFYLLPILMVLLYLGSAFLSIRFYNKKEF